MKTLAHRSLLLLMLALLATPLLSAGTIVVSNDEWMFSDGLINNGNQGGQFALNVAQFVAGSPSGNILVLSSNFGLNGGTYHSLLTGQYNVTVTSTVPASFAGYSAVFLASSVSNDSGLDAALTSYVNGGGGVFIEAGTGCCGGAAGEAAYWNPFLNNFGLSLANNYNGVQGNIGVSAFGSQSPYGPALFNGVNAIYMNNGNDVSGSGPGVQVFNDANGNGLFGAYKTASTPEPSSLALLGTGLAAFAAMLRRKLTK